jgi:hypothetical protein
MDVLLHKEYNEVARYRQLEEEMQYLLENPTSHRYYPTRIKLAERVCYAQDTVLKAQDTSKVWIQCGILNAFDGSQDHLLRSELKEAWDALGMSDWRREFLETFKRPGVRSVQSVNDFWESLEVNEAGAKAIVQVSDCDLSMSVTDNDSDGSSSEDDEKKMGIAEFDGMVKFAKTFRDGDISPRLLHYMRRWKRDIKPELELRRAREIQLRDFADADNEMEERNEGVQADLETPRSIPDDEVGSIISSATATPPPRPRMPDFILDDITPPRYQGPTPSSRKHKVQLPSEVDVEVRSPESHDPRIHPSSSSTSRPVLRLPRSMLRRMSAESSQMSMTTSAAPTPSSRSIIRRPYSTFSSQVSMADSAAPTPSSCSHAPDLSDAIALRPTRDPRFQLKTKKRNN